MTMNQNPIGDESVDDERYLVGHARVVKAVDRRYDVVGSTLACLVDICYRQSGVLSDSDRLRHGVGVHASVLDYIVECVRAEFGFSAPGQGESRSNHGG
jgi:hypothetical protein